MSDLDLSTVNGPSPELAAAVAEELWGCRMIARGWSAYWVTPDDGYFATVYGYRPDLEDSPANQLRKAERVLTDAQWGRYSTALRDECYKQHGDYGRFIRQAPAWLFCRELLRAVREEVQ